MQRVGEGGFDKVLTEISGKRSTDDAALPLHFRLATEPTEDPTAPTLVVPLSPLRFTVLIRNSPAAIKVIIKITFPGNAG